MADLYQRDSDYDETFNDRESRYGPSASKPYRPEEMSRGIGDSPPPREDFIPRPMMNSHGGAIV